MGIFSAEVTFTCGGPQVYYSITPKMYCVLYEKPSTNDNDFVGGDDNDNDGDDDDDDDENLDSSMVGGGGKHSSVSLTSQNLGFRK